VEIATGRRKQASSIAALLVLFKKLGMLFHGDM
jgi:hypothetical protein